MKFSFSSDIMHFIAGHCRCLFPMASRAIVVECNENKIRLLSWQSNFAEMSESAYDTNFEDFDSFIKSSKDFLWYVEDELPFSLLNNTPNLSYDLFNEHNRNILFLKKQYNSISYLVFIYFNQSMKHFVMIGEGIKSDSDKFSDENRSIIGQLASNSLNHALKVANDDKFVFDQMKSAMNSMVIQQKTNLSGQSGEIKLLENMIVEMAIEFLNNLSHEYNVNLVLSPNAEKRISTFRGLPAVLRKILRQAAILSVNMSNSKDIVVIEDYYIMNVNSDEKLDDENITNLNRVRQRYEKTYQLLDRFENAAISAINRGLSVTGANIGNNLNPAISAPAISDAMKKHGSKILSLLNEYPDKWNTLRQHFKPLQNILVSKNLNNAKSA